MKMRWNSWRGRKPAIVLCQLAAFVVALAMIVTVPGLNGAARAVDFSRSCSLTVIPGSEDFQEDLDMANVVVDLYKVAAAVSADGYDTYEYQMLAPYTDLALGDSLDKEGWAKIADDAMKIAVSEGTALVHGAPVNEKITETDGGETLSAGLYLLVAHGNDVENYTTTVKDEEGNEHIVSVANSSRYVYTFAPELVSLPGKEADADGVINTANPGEWLYDMEVTLKPERELRFGSLEIVKTLLTYENRKPASFVFDVEAVMGEGEDAEVVYSNVVSVTFTEAGQKSVVLDRIPVGANVTVTEVYSGASYHLITEASQTAVIAADDVVSVSFTNDYTGEDREGGSITNRFEYDEDNGWGWTKIPDNE